MFCLVFKEFVIGHRRPGHKMRSDTAPVCYCFGLTVGDVRSAPEESVARITREIEARNCACEVRNPSGNCCLGEVRRAALA